MVHELQEVLSGRDYDTMPLMVDVTKKTKYSVEDFAELHHLDFDVALEVLVAYASEMHEIWMPGVLENN